MRGLTWFLHRAGEAVSEDLVAAGGPAAGEGLKHHVVAALRKRRAVPRSVECDERTLVVAVRELMAVVEDEVVGRPVRGEDREGAAPLRTRPDGLPAVAAVFRGEHQLTLGPVEVALRPPIVGAALHPHQLFRRLVGTLLWPVKARPVLAQLVPAVLRRVDPDARRVDGDAAGVARPGRDALRGREPLPRPLRVVPPDAGPRLQFGARSVPRRVRHAILDLAGVGGG